MPTPISEKRLAANRKNAPLGGVKTPEGKAISSKNGMKYGLFSQVVVLEDVEDREQYDEMRAQFFEELQPVGILEATLVDRLVSLQWRLARVTRAESAMIQKGRMEAEMQRSLEESQHVLFPAERPSLEYIEPFRVSLVNQRLLYVIGKLIMYLDVHGLPLSPMFREELESNFGATHDFPQIKHILNYDYIAKQRVKDVGLDLTFEERLTHESLSAKDIESLTLLTEAARTFASDMKNIAFARMSMWRDIEWMRDAAELDMKLIPNEKDFLSIYRGESIFHKLFMQTLHELQRIQSTRLGKPPPMAAALDVSVSGGDGGFGL